MKILPSGYFIGKVHSLYQTLCVEEELAPTIGRGSKRRRNATIANTTGLRVLTAIAAAVKIGLMKLDLLFVAKRHGLPGLGNCLRRCRSAIRFSR
jgi:hypothetical protein